MKRIHIIGVVGGILFLILASGAASLFIPSPFVVLGQGPTVPVGRLLSIDDAGARPTDHFYLTSVSEERTSLLRSVLAFFDRGHIVMRRSALAVEVGGGKAGAEQQRSLAAQSKQIAAGVALRQAGYDVEVRGGAVQVAGLREDSPAGGTLRAGDIIEQVDGRSVSNAAELRSAIERRRAGVPATLTVKRGGQRLQMRLPTAPSPVDKSLPTLGIVASGGSPEILLPFRVRVDAQDLGGPSAALMYGLGIYDAVTGGRLAGGHRVAGAGTMALDGSIGPVPYIRLRVMAAEADGAEYFLAAPENYDQAMAAAQHLQVIRVATFDDALTFLTRIGGRAKPVTP